MAITVKNLKIDNVEMPTPALSGVTISEEKIWAADTGRLADGTMAGTIIAVKTKIEIKWPTLSTADAAKIKAAVSGTTPFHTISLTDQTGASKSWTVYFSSPSYTLYSWAEGLDWVTGISVDAIEK